MNSTHHNGSNDSSLDEGLEELGRAYGQLATEQPPELLDQAIISSAHRAVATKPGWKQFGWLHGIATASVFVLALNIILDQRPGAEVEQNELLNNLPASQYRQKAISEQSLDRAAEAKELLQVQELKKDNSGLFRMQDSTGEKSRPVDADVTGTLSLEGSVAGKSENEDRLDEARESSKRASGQRQEVPATPAFEESMMMELDSVSIAPESVMAPDPSRSTRITEPVLRQEKPGLAQADATAGDDIEQQMQAIIEMRKAGDPDWEVELDLFLEKYQDYPLPDELKH